MPIHNSRGTLQKTMRCKFPASIGESRPFLHMPFASLNSRFIGKHIYAKGMGSNLLNLVKHHAEDLARYADSCMQMALAGTLGLKSPTMGEFDHAFSRVVGGNRAPFPFETAMAYYAWSSSHTVLQDVQIPLLSINSADDPIVQDVPTDAGGNGWVAMAMTGGGGHLGWFESGPRGLLHLQRWIIKPVTEWLRAVGEELQVETPKGLPLCEMEGFVRELGGRDDLGCKEIEVGSLVVGLPRVGVFQGL
jgi:predicted alpha/beta-fold hydrolase